MSGRPLSSITADELSEMVNIARQEHDRLIKQFKTAGLGLQGDVILYLAISVAVQATVRNQEAEKFYARPWYKRLLP